MSSQASDNSTSSSPHLAAAEERAQGKRDTGSQLAREHMASAQEHLLGSDDKANASKGTMQKEKASHSQLKEGNPEHRAYSETESTSTTVSTNDGAASSRGDTAAESAKQHAKQAGREAGAAASDAGTAIKEKTHDAADKVKTTAADTQDYAADKSEHVKERASAHYQSAKASVQDKSEQAKEYGHELANKTKEKTHELSEKASETYQATKANLSEKAEQAKEYTQEMQSRAAAGLQSVKTSLANTAETIQHKAHDLSGAVMGTGKETTEAIRARLEQATEYAKEHAPSTTHSSSTLNNSRSGADYDPVYDREGSLKADDSYGTAASNSKDDSTPAARTTVDGSNTPLKGDYDRPVPALSADSYERPSPLSGGSSVLGVSTSVGLNPNEPPSLPSQEASIGGYEGIQQRDGLAEGAHLASYVQDQSEL